jgi:hypothetical protein
MGIERTVISHPGQFVEKLVPSLAQTIAYFAEQTAARHQKTSRAFTGRELPLEMLASADKALASLFAHWIDSKQVYDSAKLADVLPDSLRGRFILVEPVDGRLTITDVGPGFEILAKPGGRMREAAHGRTTGLRLRPLGARHLPPRPGDATAAPGRGGRHDQTARQERQHSLPLSASHLPVHLQGKRGNMPSRRIGR